MKFIAFYFCATAGALRPVCCGDATGWPWHDFAASLGGGQPGQGENYSSVSWKASFRSCFGLLRRSGSSQITTRFYSKHVLFLLEVRSVSTRSTFCFYSKHVLFLLEARSVSTRSTFCFYSKHSTYSFFTLHLQVCVALPEHVGRSMAAAPGHGLRTDHDERENTDSGASL